MNPGVHPITIRKVRKTAVGEVSGRCTSLTIILIVELFCMPVKFLFWEGDDEFQAQGNLLFDASATDFIHVESIVTIAAVGLEKLAKEAGVTLDRSAFPVF